MNSGSQGQAAQGQPAGASQQQKRPSQPPIFKPEDMRKLPSQFSQAEKEKWEHGLRALWTAVEKNPPDSQHHQEAKRKLFEFSNTLTKKIQNHRLQQQQQAAQLQQQQQQAGESAARPNSQGQAAPPQGDCNPQNSNASQQPKPQTKIPEKIMNHINTFPFTLPQQLTQGTPEAAKWLNDVKQKYTRGLMQMESTTQFVQRIDGMIKKRNQDGRPLSAEEEKELLSQKEANQKRHAEAKMMVDNFRATQKALQQAATANAGGDQQVNTSQQPGNTNNGGQTAQARPPMQQPNPALQNTQTVNAAIEAARNQQQMGGGRSMQQNGQPSQMPNQNVPSNSGMAQGGPVQNIKNEAGVPTPINTQMQQGHRSSLGNNSPQSAVPQSANPQSAGPQGPPRPLTHPQALSAAARTYSSGQTSGTPNVMGHSHSHPSATRETQNVITNKMPIPKHLPERATAPPQPVPMSQARPTISGGPSNSGSGVMGQPVVGKLPPGGYNLNSEGDRVLNKKKLDELVRQVTGGGEGLEGGESLTAEVEESILDVADNFVDQVLRSACKIAKERGSKVLEIRDIQLTLERGYNIRIPGYASDEIRTVRKIQPSNAWISKMSAVQAAKVTGGKSAD